MAKKKAPPSYTDDQLRDIVLKYFYERYRRGTSLSPTKRGIPATISVIRRDLKVSHQLSQQQVAQPLHYLISQGWIEKFDIVKQVQVPSGIIPSTTSQYQITAPGIDKIDGPGEFTMDRFHGIKIEAIGRNIVTVGDGNKIDARYEVEGNALAILRQEIANLNGVDQEAKLQAATYVDSIEAQLATREPDRAIIQAAWSGVQKTAVVLGIVANLTAVGQALAPFLG